MLLVYVLLALSDENVQGGESGELIVDPSSLLVDGLCNGDGFDRNPLYEGHDLFDAKNYVEAIRCYDKALILSPNNLEALLSKGHANAELGKYEEAIGYYDQALAIDADNEDVMLSKGEASAEQEKYEEATGYFDKVLGSILSIYEISELNDPRYEDVLETFLIGLLNKGNALFALKNYEEAIGYYDIIFTLEPENTIALLQKAEALLRLGRCQDAIGDYNFILAVNPKNFLALSGKGLALYCLGNYQRAIDNFDKALIEDPGNTALLNAKAIALQALGKSGDISNSTTSKAAAQVL